MSADGLKPCPFCGGNFVAQGASRDYISVWCDCGARGPEVKFPEDCDPLPPIRECYAAWNRRAYLAAEKGAKRAPLPTGEAVAWQWKTLDTWHTAEIDKFEDAEKYARSMAAPYGQVRAIALAAPPEPVADTGVREAQEQPDFTYYECPECGFDVIHKADYVCRSTACPICAGDSGHDVGMRSRTARAADKPEGKDARAALAAASQRSGG